MTNTTNPAKERRSAPSPTSSEDDNISFAHLAPTTPPELSTPILRAGPIDISRAHARRNSQLAHESIIQNTAPSRLDSHYYLLPQLPTRPLDTTKITYSLLAGVLAAIAPFTACHPGSSRGPYRRSSLQNTSEVPSAFLRRHERSSYYR